MSIDQDQAAPSQSGPSPVAPADDAAIKLQNPLAQVLAQLLFVPWAGVLAGLIVISAALTLYTPNFLTASNLFGTVAVYFSWICIAGFGEALVMIGGGLDLSVGSTMGLTGMVTAMALSAGASLLVALLAGLGTGLVVGLCNGLVVTRVGLNPFITTLGTLSAIRGLTYGIVQGGAVTPPDNRAGNAFTNLGTSTIGVIPYPVIIMLVIGFILMIFLNQTPWGRYIYAIGGNEPAARLLGIKVNRYKMLMYVISGLAAAVGGILLTAKSGTALPDAATGYELNVIAAVIIGGTSLTGGRGTMPGVLIGAALLGVINNGIVLAGLAGYWQQLIIGLVIVGAATLDILRRRLERAGTA
jgi:ribose transport system permease protein